MPFYLFWSPLTTLIALLHIYIAASLFDAAIIFVLQLTDSFCYISGASILGRVEY